MINLSHVSTFKSNSRNRIPVHALHLQFNIEDRRFMFVLAYIVCLKGFLQYLTVQDVHALENHVKASDIAGHF